MIMDIKKYLLENNLDNSKYDVSFLYKKGIDNIMSNIEFYFDKQYTCESVLSELFIRGIKEFLEKNP